MVGYIYSLNNPVSGNPIYIGSTYGSVQKRYISHLNSIGKLKFPLDQYLLDNKITPTYSVKKKGFIKSPIELRRKEAEVINKMIKNGIFLLNKNKYCGVTKTIIISEWVHSLLKTHLLNTQETIYKFVSEAITEKIEEKRNAAKKKA